MPEPTRSASSLNAASRLFGPVGNWCLYGALVVQFYVYSYNFPQDNKYIKILVYAMFFLETLQTALSGADLYYWFAADFGSVSNLKMSHASYIDLPIMGSMISLTVQFFFAYRIFVLSKKRSWWLCVIICLLSIVGLFGAFVLGTLSHLSKLHFAGVSREVFESMWIIASTLSDMFIVSAMLYHLRKIRARDGKLSNHIFVSLVRLTVETNLITTIVNSGALFLILFDFGGIVATIPAYLVGKLYSNTLLVSLNNRISIREYEAHGVAIDVQVFRSGGRSESATDTIILRPEKPQTDHMDKSIAEAEIRKRESTLATADIA